MPKEIKEIRAFLEATQRPDIHREGCITVHKSRAKVKGGYKQVTKFKLRGPRYLYTLIVDKEKAQKIEASFPPEMINHKNKPKRATKE